MYCPDILDKGGEVERRRTKDLQRSDSTALQHGEAARIARISTPSPEATQPLHFVPATPPRSEVAGLAVLQRVT
jgi:hypothetical protein